VSFKTVTVGTKGNVWLLPHCLSVRGSLEFRGVVSPIRNLSRNSDLLGPAQRLAIRRRAMWPAGCGL